MNTTGKPEEEPQNGCVIDPNPSFMKVIRSFTAEDYARCILLTASVARFGYSVGVAAASQTGSEVHDCRTEGTLMGGIIGLFAGVVRSYNITRDRLKGIPRPRTGPFVTFPGGRKSFSSCPCCEGNYPCRDKEQCLCFIATSKQLSSFPSKGDNDGMITDFDLDFDLEIRRFLHVDEN